MGASRVVHLVVNPVAGSGDAKAFSEAHVKPLLEASGYDVKWYETQSENDASRIARVLGHEESLDGSERTVVLAGGDGTMHEFIEGIYDSGKQTLDKWNLVLIPVGTANALYASTYPPGTATPTFPDSLSECSGSFDESARLKLHSLAALLRDGAPPSRLSISLLSFNSPSQSSAISPISLPSHVVISTCLHSNLLATSEGLRAKHPGVERFKIAAQANAGKFYSARVQLLAAPGGSVQIYDPKSSNFVSAAPDGQSGGDVMEDDFAYFQSSATCPRLEPTFVISPLLTRLPQDGAMDITVLRPGRDPRIRDVLAAAGHDSLRQARIAGDATALQAASEAWVPRAWEVLGKAYEDGAHVHLTYTADGGVERQGSGERVVEIYRCGGFKWTPLDASDRGAHLVCADGSLIHAPDGGTATVRLEVARSGNSGIYLWS